MQTEVAKLYLNGANVGTTISQIGIRNSTNTEYTFFVDLRLVLGESMFQKYEAFKVYLGFLNLSTGATPNIDTMFVNGLNLIPASYQGKQAGFNTAVDIFSQTVQMIDSINLGGKNANTQEFVMIKPDNTAAIATSALIHLLESSLFIIDIITFFR